jgi:hypothetical protein
MNEPVTAEEIEAGLVLELDQQTLDTSGTKVHSTLPQTIDSQSKPRPGPFVCVEVTDQWSCWSPLTTRWRRERLPIDEAWRTCGSQKWQNTPMYLSDGANLYYCFSSDALLSASREWSCRNDRRHIGPEGLIAICAEVKEQEHRQTNPFTPLQAD